MHVGMQDFGGPGRPKHVTSSVPGSGFIRDSGRVSTGGKVGYLLELARFRHKFGGVWILRAQSHHRAAGGHQIPGLFILGGVRVGLCGAQEL